LKFAPMAIPAVALLQQHDARRDVVMEPATRRRAAIEARGHSELVAHSGRKNPPACEECLSPSKYTIVSQALLLGHIAVLRT